MAQKGDAAALQKILLAARAALKAGQPARAVELAEAVLRVDGNNALALFLAGSAHAAANRHAAAAAAFRRATSLTAGSPPGSQRHQLHLTCTDNLLLEAERALPPAWLPALHDAPRLAALQAGIAAAVAGHTSASPAAACRVLVLGGLGLEAVLAARAGAAAVCLVAPGHPLAAQLCSELAADSGVGAAVAAATSLDQLSGQPPFDLVILADALGSSADWPLLRRQLAAAAPLLAGGAQLLPHALRLRGQLLECAAAVALNEVDADQLLRDTGGLDLSAANRLLPRAARSVALPAHPHAALSAPATLLELPLTRLLPAAAAAPGDSRASDSGNSTAATTQLEVTAAGAADALCWWLEQQLLPGEAAPALSADPNGLSPQHAQLHPHVWQHLAYLQHVQLAPGQRVAVRCCLAGAAGGGGADAASAAVQALSLSADEGSGAAAAGGGGGGALEFEVALSAGGGSLLLPVPAEQAAIAAAVPNYHTSMLNDSARTAAYRDGIAAALQQAAKQRREAGGQDGEPPLVLEIGSGSGLLCLLACQAGARAVVGCERLPELQAAAARLLAANGCADKVAILPKHSRELTVAGKAAGADGAAADLPRRGDMLMHEIFGSDPFSEGVVPSLLHAKQHLLRPGAALAPCRLRVVAAVAASPTQRRLARPPATVCGGAVVTRALRQLAPRKADCRAGHAGGLLLLTEPAAVLDVDFEAEDLQLADSATALLECLPRPLPLARWVAEQGAAAAQAPDADSAAAGQPARAAPQLGALAGCALYAVSWFEYAFPGGATGSSAPHVQRSEHWQQVVQLLEGDAAEAVLANLAADSGARAGSDSSSGVPCFEDLGGLLLTAGYRVDRLWFDLEGIAVAADGSDGGGSGGDDGGNPASN